MRRIRIGQKEKLHKKKSCIMKTYILERQQIIPLSLADTFSFFSDAHNLERLTPQFLQFRIMTPAPIKMAPGTLIEYRLKLFGIPVHWQTLISEWTPQERFIDEQITGPYAQWHHTHTFEDIGPEQTLMRDRVLYRIPFGPLGRIAHALVIKRMLKMIFDYRAETTSRLLAPGKDRPATAPSPSTNRAVQRAGSA